MTLKDMIRAILECNFSETKDVNKEIATESILMIIANSGEYVKKDDVMNILYKCIVIPEVDESDQVLVNYELAKKKILQLTENGGKDK